MGTESKWAARVASWRASGLSATEFCATRDFTPSAMRYWASRLRQAEAPARQGDVRIAKVVPPGSTVEADTPIVLEVGGVRVALRRGFDRDALRDLLDTLGSRTT